MDDDPFLHPERTVPAPPDVVDLRQLRKMSTMLLQTILLDIQQELDRRQQEEHGHA